MAARLKPLLILLAGVLLAACSSHAPRHLQPDTYKVRPGETLYSIAWKHDIDYKVLAHWNGIRPPYRIYPGQRLYLRPHASNPPPAGKSSAARSVPKRKKTPVAPAAKKRPAPAVASSRAGNTARKKTTARTTAPAGSKRLSWTWPLRGRILKGYSPDAPGRKGIDIAGKPGQPVLAAASGKVVYAGSGLQGYGNLIIIKHNSRFFSAYAHNRRLLVKEGSRVKKGQKIAEVGDTDAERPMLHFEIRRDGRPVNPLHYLPRR
ncbi:MAG: LysM peptidoglycan-binding domain-containing protein [Gammaproteobacteria bacterium]|nr:MAG: LysM peptidoglycan-binding domain-containing protein [Gammaproteobacteria bacterium]